MENKLKIAEDIAVKIISGIAGFVISVAIIYYGGKWIWDNHLYNSTYKKMYSEATVSVKAFFGSSTKCGKYKKKQMNPGKWYYCDFGYGELPYEHYEIEVPLKESADKLSVYINGYYYDFDKFCVDHRINQSEVKKPDIEPHYHVTTLDEEFSNIWDDAWNETIDQMNDPDSDFYKEVEEINRQTEAEIDKNNQELIDGLDDLKQDLLDRIDGIIYD